MTNEEMLGVADIVERATNRFNAQAAYHRERFDEHVKLIASMKSDHEAKMVEHRAAFGARTEADAKIIAGLREESAKYKTERDHFYQREGIEQKRRMDAESERDGLRVQVQDMREEIIRVNEAHGRTKVEHDGLLDELAVQRDAFTANVERIRRELCEGRDALRAEVAALQERLRSSIARGDFAQMEVAALKSQSPKHPVKVGEWVKRLTPSPMTPAGGVAKVTDVFEVHGLAVKIERPDGIKGTWWAKCCEPCDPPAADHDTDAGKATAESALKTEPVADEIKVGDLVEVVSNRGRNTWLADVGSLGTVTSVEEINESISVQLDDVPGKKNALARYVSFCDVRKVTT